MMDDGAPGRACPRRRRAGLRRRRQSADTGRRDDGDDPDRRGQPPQPLQRPVAMSDVVVLEPPQRGHVANVGAEGGRRLSHA
jgi:hypothetical protein